MSRKPAPVDPVVRVPRCTASRQPERTQRLRLRTKLPTTFHDVVAFRGAAESGDVKLAKGDWFLAIGRTQSSTNPNTGIESTEFIASRLGHDMARMNTQVGTPRRLSQMESADRQQPQRQVTFEPVEQDQPEHEQPVRAM